MNRRRLDSKADSACTASDVRAPAARSRAIRLFCSATIFCASQTRRDQPPGFRDRLSKQKIDELFERAFDGK
jgi:hypothetical protein